MSKAERYIELVSNENGHLCDQHALRAIEIAKEEELEYIKYQLELRLPETLDYNGVQVDREDFINDFIKAMKYE